MGKPQNDSDYPHLDASGLLEAALQQMDDSSSYLITDDTQTPWDSSARSNLGAILHLNGKKEEAAFEYHHALRLDPGDETTLANLNKLTTSQPHQVPSWTASPPGPTWSSQSQPPPSQVQPESGSNPVLNNIRDQAT